MNSLVKSKKIVEARLYVRVPPRTRLYVWPFALLYALWGGCAVYAWLGGLWDELILVPLIIIVVSHALTGLACNWSVKFNALVTCKQVNSVQKATMILVVPREHGGSSALIPLEKDTKGNTFFVFQRLTFIWSSEDGLFHKLHYPEGLPLREYESATGLKNEETIRTLSESFGKNVFEMPIPQFLELFKEHAVAPFFVFQVFCVGLWCLDEYWYYSLFTLFMLVVFESTVVQQRLKNLQEFRAMSLPNVDITARRCGQWKTVKTEDLLPGDIVMLEFGGEEELTVPGDLVLLGGTCIVNEAMISGESTPLLKESLLESLQQSEHKEHLSATEHRNHLIFGGTKILQVTSPSAEVAKKYGITAASKEKHYCIAFVMRTGFGTLQGKLVRTMIFTSERMTANNWEAFGFILFLLIFALMAAGYVLYYTWEDAARNRFKLLLDATLIITAVVPPELPMELSLAVNNSLMALSKYAIFCMEPFRIPFAGKVDVCCFDKTGTLTGENLVVKGVVLDKAEEVISDPHAIPAHSALVIATCHSLFKLDGPKGQVVGDPMEQTALDFAQWTLSSSDTVSSTKLGASAKILHRFPFSSALKRMSCIIQCNLNGIKGKSSSSSAIWITCKGAPEVIEGRLVQVPSWYRHAYTSLAHSGARVLALAYKQIDGSTAGFDPKQYSRDEAETGLTFGGFIVFHCPLKSDSAAAIRSLRESLHRVIMITGDNVLTAVHTAIELEMVEKPVLFIEDDLSMKAFDESKDKKKPALTIDDKSLWDSHDFAMTGEAVDALNERNHALLCELLPRVTVFARSSPMQKELILTTLKKLNLTTLMCGDGTNDVGALKQAHVGVALLDGKPEDLQKIMKQMQTVALRKRQIALEQSRLSLEQRFGASSHANPEQARQAQEKMQKRIEALTATLEEEQVPMVKLGDASVAAPFTSKISTIESVCNIIRQGRCTLVTTMQMYKILALNSLISAYGLSVLHLEAIRYGDFQVTVTGMLLAGCFLFLSKAQPIQKLAPHRPQPNIFNWYVVVSVLGQFCLHAAVLYFVVTNAIRWSFRMRVDENTRFTPGLTNTAVYLVSLLMQVSTFVVNYQGRPFRESLFENKPLRNSLAVVGGIAVIAAMELYPEFNEWLQLVPMPTKFKYRLLGAMALDFFGCIAIEKIAYYMLFDARPRLHRILTRKN